MIQPSEASSRTRATSRGVWLLGLALLLLTVLVYLPSLSNRDVWDDDVYLTKTGIYTAPNALAQIWTRFDFTPQYYPLVFTSFWIEQRLWGLDSLAPFHLMNALLHGLAAILLWRVLAALAVPGAWWCAAIFALHPVQVESVAWITERKNVLSGVFYFAAAMTWLRGRRAWSLGWFVAALLSKTTASTLPAALLLVTWWKEGRIARHHLVRLLPHLALGLCLGLLTAWVERANVGASGGRWELDPIERLALAGHALSFYVGKLLWPHPLVFLYPKWQLHGNAGAHLLWSGLIAAVLISLWLLRGRWGRGPLAGALFFCGTLFPALGFFNVYWFRYSYLADHFVYLATPGVIALIVAAVVRGVRARGATALRIAGAVGVALLCLLGGVTMRRQAAFRDAETLWRDTLVHDPRSAIAHNNLGGILLRRGEKDAALEHFLAAVSIEPGAEWQCNAGSVLYTEARYDEAIPLLQASARLDPKRADTEAFLGYSLYAVGRMEEAAVALRAALALDPARVEAANLLANVLIADGPLRDPTEAVRLAEDMVQRDGRNRLHLLDTLADTYAAAGRRGDAIALMADIRARAQTLGDAKRVETCDRKLALYRAAGGSEEVDPEEGGAEGGSRTLTR